jgi:hypothetical protein
MKWEDAVLAPMPGRIVVEGYDPELDRGSLRASVDGKATELEQGGERLLLVDVPAGRHRLEISEGPTQPGTTISNSPRGASLRPQS